MRYIPLRKNGKEFRLLRLKPQSYRRIRHDTEDVRVYCELIRAFHGIDVSYTAISYAWGDQSNRAKIFIGGEIQEIGTNLEAALCMLRSPDEDVLVWADQLCINQQDPQEKSHQVKKMKEIYSKATKTIAWLGPSAANSDVIMSILKDFGSSYGLTHEKLPEYILKYGACYEPALLRDAFARFSEREYWQRLWVVQEFTVSKKLLIACGDDTVLFEDMMDAIQNLHIAGIMAGSEKMPQDTNLVRNARRFETACRSFRLDFCYRMMLRRAIFHNLRGQTREEKETLLEVLATTLVEDDTGPLPICTDPRDKVFALLGLADDASWFTDLPDYSKSCIEIYEYTARKMLENGQFNVLSYCQFPKPTELASWAPVWHEIKYRSWADHKWSSNFRASASMGLYQEFAILDSRRISLRGVEVGKVREVSSAFGPSIETPEDAQACLKYLYDLEEFHRRFKYLDSDSAEIAACRVAITDHMASLPNEEHMERYNTFKGLLINLAQSAGPYEDILEQIHDSRQQTTYAHWLCKFYPRRSFVLEDGDIGIAPESVTLGDTVCIFLGSQVPYIIRDVGAGIYTLVGEAYVDGVMFGEVFNGHGKLESFILE